MLHTVNRALRFYKQNDSWNRLIQNAMTQDYSWSQSAKKYNEIYEGLLEGSEE
jgi:starch synthase